MTATIVTSAPAAPAPALRSGDPRWVRPALAGLLGLTALLYLWGLGASGYANTFYSAAAQAGATSWKAFLFGSSDGANSIMVDKPPASLWVMELSARIFGVNSWSILVPQALEGVAAVGVLCAAVRRWHGPVAGLLAGAVLALTPVAVLMFRFNNPDALLVLLMTLAAYALIRALEAGRTGWLVASAVFLGFGFLTKMMQAFLVVPGFALVYLVSAPVALRRRIGQLLAAGAALLASAGWWVALVELWPVSARPYVGGSQTNSVLELIFGYNGFGRLTGNEVGSVGRGGFAGPPPGGGFPGGPPGGRLPGGGMRGGGGLSQLFDFSMGSQIAWLLPAALLFLCAVRWRGRRRPRTDRLRASMLLWGGWLLVTVVVLSYAQGIIHPYYTVALAPAIGALVSIGAVTLWRLRSMALARILLAAAMAGSAIWAFTLLGRASAWQPWLRVVVLVGGVACALALAARVSRRAGLVLAGSAVVLALAAPGAYALDTAATPHQGAIPSAGPQAGFGDRGFAGRGPGRFAGRGPARDGFRDGGVPRQGFPGRGFPGGGPGGIGGLLNGTTSNTALNALLARDGGRYTWVAAAVGSNTAAGFQLATGYPVMPVGGFNGSDPSPTLAQFQRYVAQGAIHYFIGGSGFPGQRGGSSQSQEIADWVKQNFSAMTVSGTEVYDLTASR
ncbi:MAG TPA: glycosyltransferase family 39 protein [Pseudonocardiaceae bacterium]|nr:glycosyltransferase family 39 protein [Pseudonocardiaceae bacterium]